MSEYKDEFDTAGESRFNTDVKITDFAGELLLLTPTEYIEEFETTFGTKDALVSDVVVLSADGGPVEYPDVLIFQGGLIGALKRRVPTEGKPGRKMLGVLGKGEAKKGQNAPYVLSSPDDNQKQAARDYLAGRTVASATAADPAVDPFAVKK